jgi:hypothetical protein
MRSERVLPSLLAAALAACGPNETPLPDGPDPYQPRPVTPACVPNVNGRVEPSEFRAFLDAAAQYLVSEAGREREVDLQGGVDGAGRRTWDWSRREASDRAATIAASTLVGRWYADRFPDGEFVTPLDAGATTEAVYRQDDEALWLLGVASREPDPPEGRTLLVYGAPLPLFRFPLEPGRSWEAVGEVRNGSLFGLAYAGRDTYRIEVDAAGTLHLPDLSFTQAMRVRMHVAVSPAVGRAVERRQVSFVSECFGEVARATSKDGESAVDFTTAAEVRRLGLP